MCGTNKSIHLHTELYVVVYFMKTELNLLSQSIYCEQLFIPKCVMCVVIIHITNQKVLSESYLIIGRFWPEDIFPFSFRTRVCTPYYHCLYSSSDHVFLIFILYFVQTPRTYCAANIDDLTEVVEYVHEKYPDAPLAATGISMGG